MSPFYTQENSLSEMTPPGKIGRLESGRICVQTQLFLAVWFPVHSPHLAEEGGPHSYFWPAAPELLSELTLSLAWTSLDS